MDFSEYRFSEAHTWAKRDGDQMVIGITQYAADELGDIIFVELPDVGTSLAADEGLGSVESAKAVEDLVSPLTGEVTRCNEELFDAPEILNEDPYGEGWLVAVEPSDKNEFDSLLSYDHYMAMLEESAGDGEDDEEDDNLYTSEQ